ncbi:M23 family metallopeptidase [Oceanobacillus damuensis]|uniref:M23 family metallopeptidase n=1 Tax=Oceanobacillus damuensis TaxID=937928 RepID=UPI000835ECA9|nr:M23 family metallopeptidase [Oceanobacillus damuensis]
MSNRITEIKTRNNKGFLKKLATAVCFGLIFTSTTAFADDTLGTVYHVYVDSEHVGKIDNKEVVENLIDSKVQEEKKEFENLSLTVGEEISYISEKVFNPSYNNEKVADRLNEELSIKANAIELKIADETVGYFNDEKTANDVLEQYISEYVDEKNLLNLTFAKLHEDSSDEVVVAEISPEEKKELSEEESIVTVIMLSDDVTMVNEKVSPTDILTVEQGITMLQKGTLEEKVHTVKEGEVLGKIAGEYDLTINKLLELNGSLKEDSILKPDQEINVMEYEPFVDVIIKEEKMVEETVEYETEVIESEDMYKGEEEVKQEGSDGTKEVLYSIEKTNGKQTGKEVLDEKVTKEPIKQIVKKGTKVISSKGTGDMVWPAVGGYISSHVGERWGKAHNGIDIARPSNKNILAADNGVIESAGYDSGGYGNKIVINHNNGMKTIYAHLASIDVKSGQVVEKGSKIGIMGSTGNSTGIHLHFEVYKNGSLQNPTEYVSK